MPLSLAKRVRRIASEQILNVRALLNGRGLSKFKRLYALRGELGQGGFGIVYKGVRIVDDLPVAVKFIERRHVKEWSKLGDERVPMEICMLARCQKIEGVIALLDWFTMPEGFLIVMERPALSIDLFDFIHNQQRLNEDLARFIFRQVINTIISCTEKKVLHRDIKDENVVIDLMSGRTKLIDFGASTYLRGSKYHDFQGTRLYCPPEWFLHSLYLGLPAAVWALGVLLYNMLNGCLPFRNEKEICTAHLFAVPAHLHLSDGSEFHDHQGCAIAQIFAILEAQSLIEACLTVDPFSRPSLGSIAKHPWLLKVPVTKSWTELMSESDLDLPPTTVPTLSNKRTPVRDDDKISLAFRLNMGGGGGECPNRLAESALITSPAHECNVKSMRVAKTSILPHITKFNELNYVNETAESYDGDSLKSSAARNSPKISAGRQKMAMQQGAADSSFDSGIASVFNSQQASPQSHLTFFK